MGFQCSVVKKWPRGPHKNRRFMDRWPGISNAIHIVQHMPRAVIQREANAVYKIQTMETNE